MSRTDLTMHDYLVLHPEIRFISLVWMWDFWAIYEDCSLIMEETGELFDWEYTVVAPRDEALKHLENYDCWDFLVVGENCPDVTIEDGKLSYVHHAVAEFAGGSGLCDESQLDKPAGLIHSVANIEVKILRHIDEPVTTEEKRFSKRWNS